MKNILQIVQHLKPGGIESVVLDLIKHKPADSNVYILSLEGNKDELVSRWERLKEYEENIICLEKAPGWRPKLIKNIMDITRYYCIDIIHTHHIGPLIYGGLAGKFSSIKVMHTEHDAWHLNNFTRCFLQNTIINIVNPILIADAKKVSQTLMSKMIFGKNIMTISNGIDTKKFKIGNKNKARNFLDLPINAKIIGSAGRLEYVKGHDILLNAMTLLDPEIHLAIAGQGTEKENLCSLALALGLSDRIHFLGRIDEMNAFYQSLDIFCLPSRQEGMPLAPLEAQACGIPSVVTNVGASTETLYPELKLIAEPNNCESIAHYINKAININFPIREHMRTYIKNNFDSRVMANSYYQLASA